MLTLFITNTFLLILDLVFLTNLYQYKVSNKNYKYMILTMCICVFVIFVFFQENRVIAQIIAMQFIIFLFTKKLQSIIYFNYCFTVCSLIEIFVLEAVSITYLQMTILLIILKLLFIFIIYKEFVSFVDKIKFKNITYRLFIIIFSFVCLIINLYVNKNWR